MYDDLYLLTVNWPWGRSVTDATAKMQPGLAVEIHIRSGYAATMYLNAANNGTSVLSSRKFLFLNSSANLRLFNLVR